MSILIDTLDWCSIALILCVFAAQRFANGTRGRYVMVTVAWGLVPLSFAGDVLSMFTLPRDAPFVAAVVSTLIDFLCDVLFTSVLMQLDNDNFWRRGRKRLVRWVRNATSVHQVAPVAVVAR